MIISTAIKNRGLDFLMKVIMISILFMVLSVSLQESFINRLIKWQLRGLFSRKKSDFCDDTSDQWSSVLCNYASVWWQSCLWSTHLLLKIDGWNFLKSILRIVKHLLDYTPCQSVSLWWTNNILFLRTNVIFSPGF